MKQFQFCNVLKSHWGVRHSTLFTTTLIHHLIHPVLFVCILTYITPTNAVSITWRAFVLAFAAAQIHL